MVIMIMMNYFREGTIRAGDRIVSIDGIDMTGCSLLHASSLLTCRATAPANHRVVLVAEYDVIVNGQFLPIRSSLTSIGNESVPKIILNDTIKVFLLSCNQNFGNFKPSQFPSGI